MRRLPPLGLAILATVALVACGPPVEMNPHDVTPELIAGRYDCPGGVRLTMRPDRSFVLTENGQDKPGEWTAQDWDLFMDFKPGPTEEWRVGTAAGEAVLFRNWRSTDLSSGDPYCERVSTRH